MLKLNTHLSNTCNATEKVEVAPGACCCCCCTCCMGINVGTGSAAGGQVPLVPTGK